MTNTLFILTMAVFLTNPPAGVTTYNTNNGSVATIYGAQACNTAFFSNNAPAGVYRLQYRPNIDPTSNGLDWSVGQPWQWLGDKFTNDAPFLMIGVPQISNQLFPGNPDNSSFFRLVQNPYP